MADLPLEVTFVILSRLPVKSLLRFRCTCKLWRSLIDSSHFISFHLRNSLETNSNNLLIFRHDSDIHVVDFDKLDAAFEVVHPLMCYGNPLKVLGSCNGLICICNVAEDIALWNLSTRQHKIIALLPVERRPESDSSLFAARGYGFGYDSFSDDFKLLRISCFVDLHTRSFESQVKIYSLRTNSWKSIQRMPYALCSRTMGVFVGGALHWVVTRKLELDSPDLIIAFDLKHENFREVPMPELGNESNFQMKVALLGQSLCMLANYQYTRVDFWVMKEYGHKETWCNLFILNQSPELGSLKSVKPLAYSRDGNKVFLELDHKTLCWFDLKNKGTSFIQIPRMPSLIDGTMCVGSLVPPALESKIDKQQQELEAKKEREAFLSEGFKLVL
ncbi:hypothetical protein K1719_004962 [Acacia pycnantha]|nr:hypothetical protein K1719_004962 [Acacia pycnantha]